MDGESLSISFDNNHMNIYKASTFKDIEKYAI